MTPKERFQAALGLQTPDRLPVMYQHLGGAYHLQDVTGITIADGLRDPRCHERLCLAALREFGFDNVMVGWGDLLAEAEALGVRVAFGDPREYPVGQALPLERLSELGPAQPRDGRIWSVQMEAARRLVDEVGGEVLVIGTMNDPFLVASAVRGYEGLLMDQLTDPPAVLRLVRTVLSTLKEGARVMRDQCGLEVVFLEDCLADPVQNDIGNSLAFDIPHTAELVGHMRGLGLKVILSNCTMAGFVQEQYRDCLPDAMHIASEGRAYAAMSEIVRGERCLVSGINAQKKVLLLAPDEIEVEARRLVHAFGTAAGHVIAAGGEIPFETPSAKILALARSTRPVDG